MLGYITVEIFNPDKTIKKAVRRLHHEKDKHYFIHDKVKHYIEPNDIYMRTVSICGKNYYLRTVCLITESRVVRI